MALYETQPSGVITGVFFAEDAHEAGLRELWTWMGDSGVSADRYSSYFAGRTKGFAVRISKAEPLIRPITLREARNLDKGFRPPQSFLYLSDGSELANEILGRLPSARNDQGGPWFPRTAMAVRGIPFPRASLAQL